MIQRKRKRPNTSQIRNVTRESMFTEAMGLARQWANACQDIPKPAFDGQMSAMRSLLKAATQNKPIKLTASGKRTCHSNINK